MAQAKENNPTPRAKAPAAPKAAAANGTAPAGEKRTRPTTRRPYYNRRPRRAQQPKEAATPIHIYPLGGLGEVGKNMTVYECNGDMIIVDCGLVFPDSEMFGVDMVIPDFTFVVQNKDKIKGLLITHGHEDHIGSIPYLLQKISLPIYGTRLTCGLIKNKLEEFGLAGKTKFVEIVPRQKIKLGCFTVEPIHVNHSIPDAVAFAIDSPAGTIIQTGDFKIDYTPLACGVTDLSTLSEYGQRGVLALLSDSTNAERPGFTATEQKVAAGVRSLFARARNKRIIIATFASNIYRVQQIIDLAVEDGRKVAFSGRSMVNNTAMAQELGYMHIPEGTLISVDELNQYPPEQVVLVNTGSQGEPLSALSRMASCSHRQVRVGPGDFIIISANPIPGNEKSVTKIVNGLLLLGAEVIYESMYDVHVSGHACQEEQKLMLTLTKPKYFLPVHGEYKQLKKHALKSGHSHQQHPHCGKRLQRYPLAGRDEAGRAGDRRCRHGGRPWRGRCGQRGAAGPQAPLRGRSCHHRGYRGQQDRQGAGRAGSGKPGLRVCAREREPDGRCPEHCGKCTGALCGRARPGLEQRKDPCA